MSTSSQSLTFLGVPRCDDIERMDAVVNTRERVIGRQSRRDIRACEMDRATIPTDRVTELVQRRDRNV